MMCFRHKLFVDFVGILIILCFLELNKVVPSKRIYKQLG